MSNVKKGANQHLGSLELNKMTDFLSTYGYKKLAQQYVGNYGIVRNPADLNFDNLKVIAGSTPTLISLQAGIGIDKDVNLIVNGSAAVDCLSIPADSITRYVVIQYNAIQEEVGTVTVATNGTLIGSGTLFTKVLRGQPYHATKIKFTNSTNNLQEYEVLSVANDGSAVIQGASFTAEANLKYKVVGTFTPGIVVPAGDKDIYQYDGYTLSLSTTTLVTFGVQFLLASVVSNGTTLTIQDFRERNTASLAHNNFIRTLIMSVGTNLGTYFGIYRETVYQTLFVQFGASGNTTNLIPPSTFLPDGASLTFLNRDVYDVTIQSSGSDTIGGNPSYVLLGEGATVTIVLDKANTNWNILGSGAAKNLDRPIQISGGPFPVSRRNYNSVYWSNNLPSSNFSAVLDPAATFDDGDILAFVNYSSKVMTIVAAFGDIIGGSATLALNAFGDSCILVLDKVTNLWIIKARNITPVPDVWHYVGTGGNPAFLNSWTNTFGGVLNLRFIKDLNNVVFITGCIANTSSVNTTIFNLPLGYRPSDEYYGTVQERGALDAFKPVTVAPSGAVTINGAVASNKSFFFSISFTTL